MLILVQKAFVTHAYMQPIQCINCARLTSHHARGSANARESDFKYRSVINTISLNKMTAVVSLKARQLQILITLLTFDMKPTSHPWPTQPSIHPGSVNEYQLRLGRQRQVWSIPVVDERRVCR